MSRLLMTVLALSGERALPTRIQLLKPGLTQTDKGAFVVDGVARAAMAQAKAKRKTDLVIDYNHASLWDDDADVAGWVTAVEDAGDDPVSGGIWLTLKWEAAREAQTRKYRYVSPVLWLKVGEDAVVRPVEVVNLALTNNPAMHESADLWADGAPQEGEAAAPQEVGYALALSRLGAKLKTYYTGASPKESEMEKLLAVVLSALGLKADAKEEDAIEAFESLAAKASAPPAQGTALSMLGLSLEMPIKDFEARCLALSKPPAHTDADVQAMKARIAELEGRNAERDATAMVEAAYSAGKLTAGQKPWALGFAKRDPKGFEEFAASAPVVVAMTTSVPLPGKGGGAGGVSAEVAARLGLTKEDIEKYGPKA